MLQNFRDNLKGISAYIIVGIIIIPFALFGVDALFLRTSGAEEAASVNGEPITEVQLARAVAIRKQQMMDRFEDLSPEMINDELLREPVLDMLVRRKAIEVEAREEGMAVSQQTIYELIRDAEIFQSEGVFDPSRYEFVIRQQGYTPTSHNEMLRRDLLIQQLQRGLTVSGFSTDQMAGLLASVAEQTRDFYYLTVPVAPLLQKVELDEQAVVDHYEANQNLYVSEEQVSIEYIEINTDQLLSEIEVDEDQLREIYQSEIPKPQQARKVAHILLDSDGATANLLDEIQQKLAAGADFAGLAREYSVDYGTAESGGDLGYSTPGDLPSAMDEVLAAMSVGEISEPVITEAGTHILKLLDLREDQPPSFEERREEIENNLKQQLAQERLLEQADKLKERSYNADSLQTVADELGLELRVSEPFGRDGGKGGDDGITQMPVVVAAAFSEDVLVNGYTSELLELSDNRMLVLSLREHRPAQVQPLDDVRADIEYLLRLTKASGEVAERAKALQARVQSGESIQEVARLEGLQWQVAMDTTLRTADVDREVQRHVFDLPDPGSDPVVSIFARQNGDQVVVSLIDVDYGELESLPAQQKNGIVASTAISAANRDYLSYENALLADAEVSRN